MLCIIDNNSDIYYRLALEEFLLKRKEEDFFMIWQSEVSVVIGKHQNAMAEINFKYIKSRAIPVARRLTGGGTVYHGPGNLNFTFIRKGLAGKLVDFKLFVEPIVRYLKQSGINADVGSRNDILINGLKISGNAEHVYKNRVLHHGTLLYDANLEELGAAIKVIPGRFIDKAIQSNRSEVTNIKNYLPKPLSIDKFSARLIEFLHQYYSGSKLYTLSEHDKEEVLDLRNNKYSSDEWIYGYSPPFELNCEFIYDSKKVLVKLGIKKGEIEGCQIESELTLPAKAIEEAITNLSFDFDVLKMAINSFPEISSEFKRALLEVLF